MQLAMQMSTEMSMRPGMLAPELLLFGGSLVVLMAGSFLPRARLGVTRLLTALVLVASGVAAVVALAVEPATAFSGTFVSDTATGVARIVVVVATGLVLLIAADDLRASAREAETYALLLLAATGVLVLAGGRDLQVVVVGFLLASIPVYGLVGLARSTLAAEAAMKTYLLGALAGIGLMTGTVLLYGVAAETSYDVLGARLGGAPGGVVALGAALVIGGILFEVGAVPAHFWVPDAAQGANVTAAAFLTTVPKVGAALALYRFVGVLPDTLAWAVLVALLATASMTLGNLAAYSQTDPRRLLGWSTVSQAGFIVVPVAAAGQSDLAEPSLLFYLAAYALTNIAAFAVTAALPDRRELETFTGLGRSRPALAAALVVALLGLVGTPPTAVFVGKLTTASAAWDGGLGWLAVVVVANSLVSLFYYLRWIVPVFRPGQPPARTMRGAFSPAPWAAAAALVGAALSLALGILAGPVWGVLT
jgi:NADH-quinone oxidoreductase subunit N